MVVQRLSFRAVAGKLQVITVWRCQRSGVRVCRWSMHVDQRSGVESMTVDIVGPDSLLADDVMVMLGDSSLQLTVTLFHMDVVPNSAVAGTRQGTVARGSDSVATAGPHPRLTLVRISPATSHAPNETDCRRRAPRPPRNTVHLIQNETVKIACQAIQETNMLVSRNCRAHAGQGCARPDRHEQRELDALRTQQLVEFETLASGAHRPRMTHNGETLLRIVTQTY